MCDFLGGVDALMSRNVEKTALFLFSVLDSGLWGYLSTADVRAIFLHLPPKCDLCGRSQYPGLEECLKEAFKGNDEMEFDRFLECVSEDFQLVSYLKAAIIDGLPEVLHEWFEFSHNPCCQSVSLVDTLRPILLNGRKYYGIITRNALLCYNSVARNHLVTVILLKDAYVEDKPGNGFDLGNISYCYQFETDSAEEKQWWIGQISEIVDPHSFALSYSSLESAGHGAYGQVYKAINKETGLISAYKVISKGQITRTMELAVRKEIAALRCLKHPNVLSLYRVEETKAEIVLVTEYLGEGSLLEWLQARAFKITEKETKSIASDLANALFYMHQQCVLHRDIKLENVMMSSTSPEVHVKLIDLGLSCFLGPSQMAQEPVGSLRYVAPEVLGKLRYREKADCWSFGVLLYVLLKGTMPFGGKTEEEIVLSVLRRRLSFSSAHWSSVSPLAILAISSLLIRNPARRSSISDFLHCNWLRDD
jgi:tRNA A-37 threonylcarbamoyl transferase component Bud32